MTERQFQEQVLQLATLYRWRSYHTHDSRHSAAGFPDLVLIRPPELIFAELKSDTGRLSAEQGDWLEDLGAIADGMSALETVTGLAIDVYVWRPKDFDPIQARLARPVRSRETSDPAPLLLPGANYIARTERGGNEGLADVRWTTWENGPRAGGILWSREDGWATWRDDGDCVVRARRLSEEPPAWAVDELDSLRQAEVGAEL
jgi:hypothetical protein